MACGKYKFKLQKPMYHTYSEEIIIMDGVKEGKIFKLKPAFGILNIDSKPVNTKVKVDGLEKGVTPVKNLPFRRCEKIAFVAKITILQRDKPNFKKSPEA